jgi:hypothetical protein
VSALSLSPDVLVATIPIELWAVPVAFAELMVRWSMV